MLVRCPKCSKKLKVQDEKVGPEGMKFRCPGCRGVFLVRKPPHVPPPSEPQPAPEFSGTEARNDPPEERESMLSGFSDSEPGGETTGHEESGGVGLENPLSGWGGEGVAGKNEGSESLAAAFGLGDLQGEDDDTRSGREWELDESSISGMTATGDAESMTEEGSEIMTEEEPADEDSGPAREWELDESLVSGTTATGLSEIGVEEPSEQRTEDEPEDEASGTGREWEIDESALPEMGGPGAPEARDVQGTSETTPEEEPGSFEDASNQEVFRARRLARTIISDIALYNSRVVDDAIRSDTFFDVMGDEIREGMKLYNSRVSPEVRGTSDFYREAVEEYYQRRRSELAGR